MSEQVKKRVNTKVWSGLGFYIGDICYALSEKNYHGVWGKADYADGKYEVPEKSRSFAVGSTAIGDGTYHDIDGREYPVDAGNIGIVPLELVERGGLADIADKLEYDGLGTIVRTAGWATFEAEDGAFNIALPNDECITINTRDDAVDFNNDDDDEEEYEYWWQRY
jgi:hypothetical protein